MVPKDNTPGFSDTFERAPDVEHADVYFHLSTSFRYASVLVRDERRSSVRDMEKLPGPLSPLPVTDSILFINCVSLDCCEIEDTGSAYESFKGRDGFPISSITNLAIQGSITVWSIHLPVENMPRNQLLSIPGHSKMSDMLFFQEVSSPAAQSFVVNFQSGPGETDDAMFHFSPQLTEKKMAQSSRPDAEWIRKGIAEPMPFAENKAFDLIVASSSHDSCGDRKELPSSLCSRQHDFKNASTTFNEENLLSGNIDSAQELPLISKIKGGLDNGCLQTSVVSNESKRLCPIRWQCDSSDKAHIAMQKSHRMANSNPVLVLNENECGYEVPIKDEHLLSTLGLRFDLAVLLTGVLFQLAINGFN